ncbi:site-specific integrase [Flavobacterium sp. UW10123]|uniref:site-specific integrase n=1 Tax=Flavobacterium sp. UW10123 TaxID=3230800 RepID=UPI00339A7C14
MSIVKVIWKAKRKDDKVGYLRFSSRIGGKTVLRSLSLDPVEKKHFNSRTERLRTSFVNHEYYNNFIQVKLDEINKKSNNIKLMNDDKKSFIGYMDLIIESNITGNHGTKSKYKNLRNLVVDFNEYKYGASDIKFSEITVDFLVELRTYMKKIRKNKDNSIYYKFRTLKSFISKAAKNKVYTYDVNPFDLITNTLIETKMEVLNKEDLKKLMNTQFIEVYRSNKRFGEPIENLDILKGPKYKNYLMLDDYRNFFLFQLFSQGLRVSDLITLRWQDFYIDSEQIRIKKRMVKVKKSFVSVFVNYNTMNYLVNYIPTEKLSENILKLYSEIVYRKYTETRFTYGMSLKEMKEFYKFVEVYIEDDIIKRFNLPFTYSHYKLTIGGGKETTTEGVSYKISIDEVTELIESREKELSKMIKKKDLVAYEQQLKSLFTSDEKISYLKELLSILQNKLNINKNNLTENLEKNKATNYKLFTGIVEFLSSNKKTKKSFVFPLLNDDDFNDITDDDFSSMSEYQYNKFTGKRAYYNRILKVIGEQSKINKNLTSHLARHSFTTLMLEIGVNLNLFDLMTSLGHKHLSTTQNYISKFSDKKVVDINKSIADYVNNI